MISIERFMCNMRSVEYINRVSIPGDIVEIGVWRGGSILSMIKMHEQNANALQRRFHLYDTFTGMTPATNNDIDHTGRHANELIQENPFFKCESSLSEVKHNIASNTSISSDLIKYHVGDICNTPKSDIPDKIAILRLDTDWYESTKFELENFYNHVSEGGIVIVDDYGHWQGAKRAVDEFLQKHPHIILKKIDYTGVYFVKPFETRENMISAIIPKNGIYGEIGVFKGEFAKWINDCLKPNKFYLYDIFEGITCSGNADGNYVVNADISVEFENLKRWAPPNVIFFKGDSSTNISIMPDNYFDMIYIDGDHSYEGVKRDINVAFKKVKPDGFIMGHDYEMNMKKAQHFYSFGVDRAVNEFCQQSGQEIFTKALDGCVSFAIQVRK
jgi:O-methyltransferase